MEERRIEELVYEWDDVYKKGQSSLWVLLSIYEGKKFSAEILEFMYEATDGTFEVKEQSLYRALRRFKGMGMVTVSEEDSPNGGPKRKFYELTTLGREVLGRFIDLHIAPLMQPGIRSIIERAQVKGANR